MGFSRFDVLAWGVAVLVGIGATAIGWAAGARLGAALAVAAMLMVAVIVVAMAWDARGRSFPHGQ